MMVAAFSHSNAVGKLPLHLPDVPKGVRFDFPRYSPVEASSALQYYHRYEMFFLFKFGVVSFYYVGYLLIFFWSCSRKLTVEEPGDSEKIRLYYLTGGNGKEIRTLCRFL